MAPLRRGGWRLPILLLILTFLTTLMTGIGMESAGAGLTDLSPLGLLLNPSVLLRGLPYSLCLLAILGTHEMGHYLACRRYRIDATPPYFLPSPFLLGTFGAFIRIRAPITDRKALFDIGIAGPLAGFVVAVPVLVWGVLTSEWRPIVPDSSGYWLGECLSTKLLSAFVGAPPEPEGYVLTFGGVATAGWVGFLATALNLLPIGQLDGGHITYALSRRVHRWTSRLCLAGFVALGLTVNESWLFWGTLLVLFSPSHPRLIDEESGLPSSRIGLALIAAVVLVLCFMPDPIRAIP